MATYWPHLTLPDGGRARWLTQSGRVVLAALCRELGRTGYLRITAQQRTLAAAAGVSLSTLHRGLHRWIDVGVLNPTHDDRGQLIHVEVVPSMLARLLPDARTETSQVHTPKTPPTVDVRIPAPPLDELLLIHDAWSGRPPGAIQHVGACLDGQPRPLRPCWPTLRAP